MTQEREILEKKLKELAAAKKAAKANNDIRGQLENSRGIIATIREIAKLPEDNQIDGYQISAYCWALQAIASKSDNGNEARDSMGDLISAYRKKIDIPNFWGEGRDFGRTLFFSIIMALHRVLNDGNDGAKTALLKKIGGRYLEILDLRAKAFLDDAAFEQEPITDAQRTNMERNNGGKKIRMKAWPSLAEKAFVIMHRCLKADMTASISKELADFLELNAKRGEWLGFYCALAKKRIGDFAGTRNLLTAIVRKKRNEMWAWSELAGAYPDKPEEALDCYCKALLCPIHDPQIAIGQVIRIRRSMMMILRSLGRMDEANNEESLANGKAMPDIKNKFYQDGAKRAEKSVLGDSANGGAHESGMRFSGLLQKHGGNAFGFVKDAKLGSVFIPPRFAEKHGNGEFIKGIAKKREDKKKNKLSWCMTS